MAVMRWRTMAVVMIVIVLVMAVGALAEFRLDGGVADAVLYGEPLLDGADRLMRVDAIVEAGMQRRHVARAIQRPDMHVVHLAHALDGAGNVLGNEVAVEARRASYPEPGSPLIVPSDEDFGDRPAPSLAGYDELLAGALA